MKNQNDQSDQNEFTDLNDPKNDQIKRLTDQNDPKKITNKKRRI